MQRHQMAAVALCVSGLLAAGLARVSTPPGPQERMAAAASAFLDSLGGELRKSAVYEIASPVRLDWHYIPRDRPGVKFKQLGDPQRRAMHALLQSALSSRGYLKATSIMELEGVLHDMEVARGGDGLARDAGNYAITIFGEPGAGTPWGWRLEGHHISLNFTGATGQLVASTPAFLGANPAMVPSGPHAGWRILAQEEDMGYQLLQSLSAEQRAAAMIPGAAPVDIILTPGRAADLGAPYGVKYAAMNEAQRTLLLRLIEEYVENLQHDMAEPQMARIREKGLDAIAFAWAGADQPGKGHYYRIHGPTFVIEFDNTQNDANHIHTVWHDLERDFGTDLLKEHYEHDHRH